MSILKKVIIYIMNNIISSKDEMATFDLITFKNIYNECMDLLPTDMWSKQCDLVEILTHIARQCVDLEYRTVILKLGRRITIKTKLTDQRQFFKEFIDAIFQLEEFSLNLEMAFFMYDTALSYIIRPLMVLSKKLIELLIDINKVKGYEAIDDNEW